MVLQRFGRMLQSGPMTLVFLVKLLIVIFFLVMFVRGSRLVWGVGLLTVTTAFLLDTLRLVLGGEPLAELGGAFQFVIGGALFGGAALWLWGLARPALATPAAEGRLAAAPGRAALKGGSETAIDRQMLFDQIRYRLGPGDVRDLLFDLRLNENDIMLPDRPVTDSIVRLMDEVSARGQTGELALAVERVLTPPEKEQLPRREKLSPESPPTVLRHFILAYYDLDALHAMVAALGVEWEMLEGEAKPGKVRALLQYLDRRNRVDDLIAALQDRVPAGGRARSS